MEQLKFPVTKKEAEKAGIAYSSEANKNALFPSLLRKLREKKGVSQAGLAKAMGVSKSTIGLYETGDTLPDIRTADQLASYFEVSADYLIGRTTVRSEDLNIQQICAYTGLSEDALTWIEDMKRDPNAEGIQVLDRMLATEQFRFIISHIVYITKFFDEMKHHNILSNLSAEEFSILQKAREIVLSKDEYEIYDINLEEKAASSKSLLQEIFIEMVEDLFYHEKEWGKFPLYTPIGDNATFIDKEN